MSDVMQQLREADRDRYFSLFFVSEPHRSKLACFYLIDAEIQKIRQQVSEPQLGLIRLQWWREAIAQAYAGQAVAHPVLAELAQSLAVLPRKLFDNMLDAAEHAQARDQIESVRDLETWLGNAYSMVIQGAMLLLGGNAPEVAGLGGVAIGLARQLAHGETWFYPKELGKFPAEAERLAWLSRHASLRLDEARSQSCDRKLLPALLPVTLTELYLRSAIKTPGKPSVPSAWRRQFAIWLAARRESV